MSGGINYLKYDKQKQVTQFYPIIIFYFCLLHQTITKIKDHPELRTICTKT